MEEKDHKECYRAPVDVEEFLTSDDYYAHINKLPEIITMFQRLDKIEFDPIEIAKNEKKANLKTDTTMHNPIFFYSDKELK